MNREYQIWLEKCTDPQVLGELKEIREDEKAIEDRFYSSLKFGTGGLRGIVGAGTNRMNVYTVGRAARGYARWLKAHGAQRAAVSCDNRRNSDVFARECAAILARSGLEVYIYSELMPTPMLSYAVREKQCGGGVMITASHNPAMYNGFKAYGADGCQLTDGDAHEVEECIDALGYFDREEEPDFETLLEAGRIRIIGQDVIDRYLDMVLALAPGGKEDAGKLKIVYTPLNGTGRMPVTAALKKAGFSDVTAVPEQEFPDTEFTTCPYPNPEFREALELGLKLMREKHADLLLATDPDCDRVGTAVWDGEEQRLITGNEMGVLLMDYLCSSRLKNGTMPQNPVAVKTIVTTEMARRAAEAYGVEMRDVLTGFKYIGEQIAGLEKEGHPERFLLGFEESYGYLTGTDVRDKDGVNASLVICRMAAEWKKKGKTLADALRDAEARFGTYRNVLENYAFPGQDGMRTMAEVMDRLRNAPPKEVLGMPLCRLQDYGQQTDTDFTDGTQAAITLPRSNVLKFFYGTDVTAVVRPSGTEPKLKIYHAVRASDAAEAERKMSAWREAFREIAGLKA